MKHIIRAKRCRSFLLTCLLFSLTAISLATFTDEECKEIKAEYTRCECVLTENQHLIKCPAKSETPKIEMKIFQNPVDVSIKFNDIKSNQYELLPLMDIGNVVMLFLTNYTLSSGPISHLLRHLGITKLEHIDMTLPEHSNVTVTRQHLSGLADLKRLVLVKIDLAHISEDTFIYLPNLTNLILLSPTIETQSTLLYRNSNLNQLPAGIFRNLHKLLYLSIGRYQLKSLNKELFLGITPDIRSITLSHNGIESIAYDTFSSLTNLEIIDLSYNELKELPAQLFAYNKQLIDVRIRFNSVLLQTLPSTLFTNLMNLEFVDITCGDDDYDNSIRDFEHNGEYTLRISCGLWNIPPDFFTNTTKFNTIFLNKNELSTLHTNLFVDQLNLNRLDLSENRLDTLPIEVLRATTNLQVLNVSYNLLSEITLSSLTSISSLKEIGKHSNHAKTRCDNHKTFTDEDCNGIMTSNTQCECLSSLNKYVIKCPQIEMNIIKNPVMVKIKYNDNVSNPYELLPAIDICTVDKLFLANYSFASGPVSHLLHHLGITKLKSISITLSDQSNITITRQDLSKLADLEHLELFNIEQPNVLDNIFMDLQNLTNLHLSAESKPNVLTDESIAFNLLRGSNRKQELLPAGMFRNLRKLQDLRINGYQQQTIDKELFLGKTSAIRKLNLSRNGIESIHSDTFAPLINLEQIDLSYNKLQELPAELFSSNKQLTHVLIRYNRVLLEALPSTLFTNLMHLKLVDITCENDFGYRFVDVSEYAGNTIRISCGLWDIPSSFFANSTKFNQILLSYNALSTVHMNLFSDQFNLNYVDLSENRLNTLPVEVFRAVTNLTKINVSSNLLSTRTLNNLTMISGLKKFHKHENHFMRSCDDSEKLKRQHEYYCLLFD